jgi:hypothetical protein
MKTVTFINAQAKKLAVAQHGTTAAVAGKDKGTCETGNESNCEHENVDMYNSPKAE